MLDQPVKENITFEDPTDGKPEFCAIFIQPAERDFVPKEMQHVAYVSTLTVDDYDSEE